MNWEKWYAKYRRIFGCKNHDRICWCHVCSNLSRAWKDSQSILQEIRKVAGDS